MKTPKATKATVPETAELMISSEPSELLLTVYNGQGNLVSTRQLNIFYVHCDRVEKFVRDLKTKCHSVIVGRRDEGVQSGDKGQHREFVYQTPQGEVKLIVQERSNWKPDPGKMELLLRSKGLWDQAIKEPEIDMEKVNAMYTMGLITPEEFDSVLDTPEPTYALVAKFKKNDS